MKLSCSILTLITLLTLIPSCSNRILKEVTHYENNQFEDSSKNREKIMLKLKKINRSILKKHSNDSFWLINYFSIKTNYFGGLYISKTDTFCYSLYKNKTQISKSVEAIEDSKDILNFIFRKDPLPKEFDGSMFKMILKIENFDSINISGFNINNGNEVITKFK